MDLSDPFIILLLLSGPVAGSFFGLAADRLSRGESIVAPRSHCRACKAPLGPRDLVPVLSFVVYRGRCRRCGAPIPPWLLYFELIATGIAVLAAILAPTPGEAWATALFLWLLLALTASDLIWFRLPNLLTGALFLSALLLAWLTRLPPPEIALWGAIIGAGAFFALRLAYQHLRGREGLGMGDVKLMAGLGAALGPELLPAMVLLASLSALAAALAGTLRQGRKALGATRAMPFGAALTAATAVLWLVQRMPV